FLHTSINRPLTPIKLPLLKTLISAETFKNITLIFRALLQVQRFLTRDIYILKLYKVVHMVAITGMLAFKHLSRAEMFEGGEKMFLAFYNAPKTARFNDLNYLVLNSVSNFL
ncbi:MAG: hypothetical protein LBE09_09055, partial [Christensenellaceae bacterium]|nr:hypothetical protein [Christensenellaceae bacterium]